MANKFPNHIMKMLRMRRDLDDTDTSEDDVINNMTGRYAFAEVCAWELGTRTWSDEIISWMSDCGLVVMENGAEVD